MKDTIIEEFRAIFRGGLGPSNNIKWVFVKCKILAGHRSMYKYIGPKKLSSLWNGDWHPGPTHLETESFIPIDMEIDGEFVQARIYNMSLQREEYIENLQQSSAKIQLEQAKLKIIELEEQLATAIAATKDINLEDKRKAIEKENSEHYKEIRGNIYNIDYVGGGRI